MWYVIQTRTGAEPDLVATIASQQDPATYKRCFAPMYEDVRRSHGVCEISLRRLIPGYVFIDTEDPVSLIGSLKRTNEFTRILGVEEEDKSRLYIPVGEDDAGFLDTLFEEGIMHVSYIHMTPGHMIDRIVGPLAGYRNHITKLDIPHRRAIVETDMFGKRRKIRFGLWTDQDEKLPGLEERLAGEQQAALDDGGEIDIGIHPGDRVVDETGLYGDYVFAVEHVDSKHRKLITSFDFKGTRARLELDADGVRLL